MLPYFIDSEGLDVFDKLASVQDPIFDLAVRGFQCKNCLMTTEKIENINGRDRTASLEELQSAATNLVEHSISSAEPTPLLGRSLGKIRLEFLMCQLR